MKLVELKTIRNILTLFIAVMMGSPCAVAQLEQTIPKASQDVPASAPLQAGVEFSEKIQSLDPVLWPGNVFDKEVAKALLKSEASTKSIWSKIPTWQAGEWESEQATTTQAVKYQNGQPVTDNSLGVYTAKNKVYLGHEIDKNSNIWQLYDSGYWTNTDHGDSVGYAYVKSHMPGDSDYPDEYGESVVFEVDKLTNKIIDVQQRKTWGKYVPIEDGLMKEEDVHTVYDEHGEPIETAWNTSLCRRKKTFSEHGSDKAKYSDFVAYLKNSGLKNSELGELIPDAPKESVLCKPVPNNELNTDSHNNKSTQVSEDAFGELKQGLFGNRNRDLPPELLYRPPDESFSY